jgi:phage terminase small subunit
MANTPKDKNSVKSKKPKKLGKKKTAKEIKQIVPDYVKQNLKLGEARFIAEYITNGFMIANAYNAAFCTTKRNDSAKKSGIMLLKKPHIKKALSELMEAWLCEKKESMETNIIKVLWNQAFYDISMYVNPDGSVAFDSWDDIPEDKRYCVASIKKKVAGTGRYTTQYTEIEFTDRKSALEKLSKYIDLFKEHHKDDDINNRLDQQTQKKLTVIFKNKPKYDDIPEAEVIYE